MAAVQQRATGTDHLPVKFLVTVFQLPALERVSIETREMGADEIPDNARKAGRWPTQHRKECPTLFAHWYVLRPANV
jgi:hypothetical protein